MTKGFWLLAIALFFLSGCVKVVAPVPVKSPPPGQVQKATGYNPASGKVKGK